ncbi:MAG: response regulator [Caulobacter sp. 12-67-6]|nr:MAG: response regulator [Caulobacter sp. 12-67-6]OYX72775.1 MAG: response regulator [Caulobacter sp. 32-67-35]
MRVLFVDDNAMNRTVVKSMLAAAEVEMVEAADAEIGLALVEAQHFDVILMDYRMPRMDGLAAIGAIRARPDSKARLPIIMVTADDGPDLRNQAIAAGADDLLHKPIQMQPLFDAIGQILARGDVGAGMLV